MRKRSVIIIGAGTLGTSLACLLKERGYPVVGIASRTPESAARAAVITGCPAIHDIAQAARSTQIVFLTVPDRQIEPLAERLSKDQAFTPGQVVSHTSGALSSSVLSPARDSGAHVLSLHPLQTFADFHAAVRSLPGTYFALEGDPEALPVGRQIVEDLGGNLMEITPEQKPLYHAAASIACNYTVALVHLAVRLLVDAGLQEEQALRALLPLMWGTLENLKRRGSVGALTGPIARGDLPTVKMHLESLKDEKIQDLYRVIGRYAVGIAVEKGTLDESRHEEMCRLLGDL